MYRLDKKLTNPTSLQCCTDADVTSKKIKVDLSKVKHFGNAQKESLSGCWFVFLFYPPDDFKTWPDTSMDGIAMGHYLLVYAFGIVCRNGEAD